MRFASLFVGILLVFSSSSQIHGEWKAEADPRQICIVPANGDPGTIVRTPITLHDGDGVAGFQVQVKYDTDILSFVGAGLGIDTQAAGTWILSSGQAADVVSLAAASPVGLTPGFKEMVLVDFEVTAGIPITNVPFPLMNCVIGDQSANGLPCEFCLQPGVDAAFPRYAEVLLDDSLSFQPALLPLESGNWVIWENVGVVETHTTTSGTSCLQDGLWDASLSPGQQFARRFLEAPDTLHYFCTAHCVSNHTGEIQVTAPIQITASEISGAHTINWTGSDQYRVFRSGNPLFVGTNQQVFVPDGGVGDTSFTDGLAPGIGDVFYYFISYATPVANLNMENGSAPPDSPDHRIP